MDTSCEPATGEQATKATQTYFPGTVRSPAVIDGRLSVLKSDTKSGAVEGGSYAAKLKGGHEFPSPKPS